MEHLQILSISDMVTMQSICFSFFVEGNIQGKKKTKKEIKKDKRHLNTISPGQTDLFGLLYKTGFPDKPLFLWA